MELISLEQILALVGNLDDTPGENTARDRFRSFLSKNLTNIADMRDYIEECLRHSGDQYNKALQDLVNHLGRMLGFEVIFGRYKGVQGEIGFDGLWKSPSGLYIVVEVKTTDVYSVKTSTLIGYIDGLISEKRIPDWDHALGLYVIGRPDADSRQLENSIIAEKRTHQLRIVTIDKLLELCELLSGYEMEHEAVLTILLPTGPTIDPFIDLIGSLVAKEINSEIEINTGNPPPVPPGQLSENARYYLVPVGSEDDQTAEERISKLLGAEVFACNVKSPLLKAKPADWICFYAAQTGIVAHARIAASPVQKTCTQLPHPEKYPYLFEVDNVKIYTENPVVLKENKELLAQLDAFKEHDLTKPWSWFVQVTRTITEHDFMLLTRNSGN
jgi:hypothetical protein